MTHRDRKAPSSVHGLKTGFGQLARRGQRKFLPQVWHITEDCMAASTLTSGFIKKFPPKAGTIEEIKQHTAENGLPSPHAHIPGEVLEGPVEGPSKEDLEIFETWREYRADPN